jgi:hypothetical protein
MHKKIYLKKTQPFNHEKKYVILIELTVKGDPFACLKGE